MPCGQLETSKGQGPEARDIVPVMIQGPVSRTEDIGRIPRDGI